MNGSSWSPVDLRPILAGDVRPPTPTVLRRADGVGLFYAGAINAVYAEPEAGKTWLTLAAAAEQVRAGEHVVYIDWEMAAHEIVNRLRALGVSDAAIAERFHYVHPEEMVDTAERDALVGLVTSTGATLVVLDGLAEALAAHGQDENDNSAVAFFFDKLPRPLSWTGAAVVVVDHVTKDTGGRGRWARGAGHKLSAVTGAGYALTLSVPFGRDRIGQAAVALAKDRHAGVSFVWQGKGRIAGRLVVDATGDGVRVTVEAPTPAGEFRPTFLMERVSRYVERLDEPPSQNAIRRDVPGSTDAKLRAVEALVADGYFERVDGARGARLHRSVKPYRQENDPASDRYATPDGDDETRF